MKKRVTLILLAVFCLTVCLLPASGDNRLQPFSQRLRVRAHDFKTSSWMKMPLISWGADLVTVYANGGKLRTVSGSPFSRAGLRLELFREDDFTRQVKMYVEGDSVYLRGTMGMLNMAADITEIDNRTKMIVIYQHSWSSGGDALVVKAGINSVKDLKGKTIAIQSYGPHVDYMMKLLADARLSINDVNIVWTDDLVGPGGDTPMDKLNQSSVQAAFVIIPDALALTSGGKIGTGAEDSIKGARILLSTKTANRIINDAIAVRKDYFASHPDEVRKVVKALFEAEEEVKELYKRKDANYKRMLSDGAAIILDSAGATSDMEGMCYFDAELAGYDENRRFFDDTGYLRNFPHLNDEIQASFLALGLLTDKSQLEKAGWDYTALAQGLSNVGNSGQSRFNTQAVQTAVAKKQQQDTIDEAVLFSLTIYFQPNQNTFSADFYSAAFQEIISLASTYGGAVITVEGHSDPMGYLRRQKEGGSQVELTRIKQAAKNLSYSRANAVRDEIVNFATGRNISLDPNQFATIGYGISKPAYPVPETKEQWLENMRVEFKIIQIEAESDVFIPLD